MPEDGAMAEVTPLAAVGWEPRAQALLGLVLLIGLCWAVRERRPSPIEATGARFPWRLVVVTLGLQLLIAALVLKTRWIAPVFVALNDAFVALMTFSGQGARFLFGDSVDPPHAMIAFGVLTTIVFFSSLTAIAYHSGAMVWVVRGCARGLARWTGISGAESLSAVGNIVLGPVEAPMLVRPFLALATRSELHGIMVAGFGTVAGGVMAAYVDMLRVGVPHAAGHLMAASVMAAPASVLVAKLLLPETDTPQTHPDAHIEVPSRYQGLIDAAASGAAEGTQLAVTVAGVLLAFIALVALLNAGLDWFGGVVGVSGLRLEVVFGWLFTPVAWLMGVEAGEAREVGGLLGVKLVLNEFLAYLQLSEHLKSVAPPSPRTALIASYALCGFANFGTVAIQVGGMGGMVPERRADLAALGLRALLGGSVVGYMTAAVVGLLA
jgi:CNT family concentrative nucleoside transporter